MKRNPLPQVCWKKAEVLREAWGAVFSSGTRFSSSSWSPRASELWVAFMLLTKLSMHTWCRLWDDALVPCGPMVVMLLGCLCPILLSLSFWKWFLIANWQDINICFCQACWSFLMLLTGAFLILFASPPSCCIMIYFLLNFVKIAIYLCCVSHSSTACPLLLPHSHFALSTFPCTTCSEDRGLGLIAAELVLQITPLLQLKLLSYWSHWLKSRGDVFWSKTSHFCLLSWHEGFDFQVLNMLWRPGCDWDIGSVKLLHLSYTREASGSLEGWWKSTPWPEILAVAVLEPSLFLLLTAFTTREGHSTQPQWHCPVPGMDV